MSNKKKPYVQRLPQILPEFPTARCMFSSYLYKLQNNRFAHARRSQKGQPTNVRVFVMFTTSPSIGVKLMGIHP